MVWSQKKGQRDSARNLRTCDRMLMSGWCQTGHLYVCMYLFIYLFIYTKEILPYNTIVTDTRFLFLDEFLDSITA